MSAYFYHEVNVHLAFSVIVKLCVIFGNPSLKLLPLPSDWSAVQAELVTTVPGVSSIHELHVWRLVGRSGRCCSCSVTV